MADLPASNIINVTITATPSGLAEKNVNSLALFTTDQSAAIDGYGLYISARQVANDFGTNSVTAQMANAIFSQTPNLLTGTGRLVIIPLISSVSAVAGSVTTPNISANITNFAAVTDGQIRITVGGVNNDISGLNFTGVNTLAQIARIIQARILTASVDVVGNTIKITNKKAGTGNSIVLASTGGAGTSIIGSTFLNTGTATTINPANSSGETILNAIARTEGAVGYVGVMTNLDLEDTAVTAIANGIQAQDRLFFHHFASTADIAGFATANKNAGNKKTRPLLYTAGLAAANLFKAAYAGRALSVNFNGSNTSQTMNLKQLSTIVPDNGISQTIYGQADAAGIDLYVSYDGVPSVFSTGGNDYFDNQYSDLALKFALQTAGFNYLRQTNTKVPQTEPGMDGLKNAYVQTCERFVRCATVAPGSWTSSETFGDPQTFKANITQKGYYVYSLPIVLQSAAERETRKAPLVQIAIKRAGAIHTGDVTVNVNA